MSIVTKLPTAAKSYYTVNKAGRFYYVVLVTPVEGGRPIKTRLYRVTEKQYAYDMAREIAKDAQRPLKAKGGAA